VKRLKFVESILSHIIRKGNVMKTRVLVLLLGIALTFVVVSCSDNPTQPVSPVGTSMSAPSRLAKTVATDFSFVMLPTGLTDPGITKLPDGKVMLRGLRGPVYFKATFSDGLPDLLTGPGEVEINFILDYSSGVGESQGKLTLRPAAPEAASGAWEFTWHGTATLGASGWTLPLKEEGHGVGGALIGMQCRLDNIVTTPVDVSSWGGSGQGVVASH
jgi:hypothetical protein